ncbi:MAG: type II toxin-antitoxin system VapC family toxin [Acidimicrobiia bacterium]|jgi:predicted nucleic acid-binding protein|nr:type II toxin-antitoxin system VapC family toxin [Acidimicrobiia bacterium]
MAGTYLDSSAIVKLAINEPQSDSLRRYIRRRRPLVSSALARTEVLRALLDEGDTGLARGREVLARLDLVRVNDRVLNAAGTISPEDLRSLDAIHLATALELGDDIRQLVTYDDRMTAAATALGLRTAGPG